MDTSEKDAKYQSHYCASQGAFLFSFVYTIYLIIVSYLNGKQMKSKLGNKSYLLIISFLYT